MTGPLRKAASAKHRPDLMAVYTGQGLRMLRPMPAADLVATLEREIKACLQDLSAQKSVVAPG